MSPIRDCSVAPSRCPHCRTAGNDTSESGCSDRSRPCPVDLRHQFGDMDIYLFDQLLRGRIRPGMRVLDAGCGAGRNLVYLLRAEYEVFGADADPRAIAAVREMAAALAPQLPAGNFRAEPLE